MKSVQLVLGTVNCQPEGNFDEVYEQAYQRAYKPFLSVLNNFPEIPVVLHYSGALLEWLEEKHPEFLMLLREMVSRKQVELLGGGFYEPILSLIPDSDKLGQIEKMTTHLRANFGIRPRGSWITERVWEPCLVKILKNSGMDYTFLDDRYFHIAGVERENCYAPYLTEDQGKTITVFPIDLSLGRMVPFKRPAEVVKQLYKLSDAHGQRVVSLIIQGEKLGWWDDTYDICYKQDWLGSFLSAIKENQDRIIPVTPGRYLKQTPVCGKVYFPSLSYEEMMEWALSNERQRSFQKLGRRVGKEEMRIFLHGGYFRQFLTKYPEINLLYSRMIHTHILVNQIRGDKYKKQDAKNELWKGQFNAVYWHGRFGGVYTNHLRKSAYRSFIEAEKIARRSEIFMPSIISTDFDMDGREEFLYQGKVYNAYIHRLGGSAFELDYLPASWNYLDTMARWPESFHQDKLAGCDWYWRRSFLDHFFSPDADIDAFDRMEYTELGDFLNQPFEPVDLKREHNELTLKRTGYVQDASGPCPLQVRKRYIFRKSSLDLDLTLINECESSLDIHYGLEVNLALASRGEESSRLFGIKEGHSSELGSGKCQAAELDSVRVQDQLNKVRITLSANKAFGLWSLPVETACRYPSGERIYQSSCLVSWWQFRLKYSEQWEIRVSLSLEKA